MKLVPVLLTSLLFMGCSTGYPPKQQNIVEHARLDGVHKLRKVFTSTKVETTPAQARGSYFLFMADFQYEGEKRIITQSIKFAWEDGKDHAYAIGSVPLRIVRIQIDDSKTEPAVYFHWHEDENNFPNFTIPDTSDGAFKAVDEVTFICNSSDWPVDIQLPMNDEGKQ